MFTTDSVERSDRALASKHPPQMTSVNLMVFTVKASVPMQRGHKEMIMDIGLVYNVNRNVMCTVRFVSRGRWEAYGGKYCRREGVRWELHCLPEETIEKTDGVLQLNK
jgi:hypothetical protein